MRPDFTQEFILYTDASRIGLGAVLSQLDQNGKERVVAYASRSLSQAEKNYSATELEFLAIIWTVLYKFNHYLRESQFTVYTDHKPLVSIVGLKEPLQGRIANWVTKLMGYQINIKYQKGLVNKNADALSRLPPQYS